MQHTNNWFSVKPTSKDEIIAYFNGKTLPITPGIPPVIFRDMIYHILLNHRFKVYDLLTFGGDYRATQLQERHGNKRVLVNGYPKQQILWSNFCNGDAIPPCYRFNYPGVYYIGDKDQVLRQGKNGKVDAKLGFSMGSRINKKFVQYGMPTASVILGIVLDPEWSLAAEGISRDEYRRLTGINLS